MWEGKEEGVKTGNFAKVPKFSVAGAQRGTLVADSTDSHRLLIVTEQNIDYCQKELKNSLLDIQGSGNVKSAVHITSADRENIPVNSCKFYTFIVVGG